MKQTKRNETEVRKGLNPGHPDYKTSGLNNSATLSLKHSIRLSNMNTNGCGVLHAMMTVEAKRTVSACLFMRCGFLSHCYCKFSLI